MPPNVTGAQRSADPWNSLRQFARPRASVERCELCAVELSAEHQHLVELSSRQLLCACDACAVLFDHQGESNYRRVPRRSRFLSDFRLNDVQWNRLAIPVGLAFFFYHTPAERVIATYPSPAGPTESPLDLELWDLLVGENRVLHQMAPDVEALLANRVGEVREYYLAPIDTCYELIGLIRSHWQGFSGGQKVWQEIEQFFDRLKKNASGGAAAPNANA